MSRRFRLGLFAAAATAPRAAIGGVAGSQQGNVTRPQVSVFCPKQPGWLPLNRISYPNLEVIMADDRKFLRYKKGDPEATAGTSSGSRI